MMGAQESEDFAAEGAWRAGYAERLAALLAQGRCCDAMAVSEDGLEVPVVRALLAACSPVLREACISSAPGGRIPLPASAAALRAVVAFACGAASPAPAPGLHAAPPQLPEVISASRALDLPELAAWWQQHVGVGGDEASEEEEPPAGDGEAWASRQARPAAAEAAHGEGSRGDALLLACSGVLAGAAVWAWMPAFGFNLKQTGFFMDDRMIKRNANVVEPVDWHRLFRTDYWGLEMFQEGTWTHKSFRPLTVLSFRFNYWLHSFDSTGFHITNLLALGLSSALLGLLGRRALGLSRAEASLLAALFLAHPVHTESVLYIVGRADLLCFVLICIAVLVYDPCAQGRCRGPIMASVRLCLASALLVAAGLCKETGFCFFGLLAGWEIMRGLMGCSSWRRWLRLAALLAVGGSMCYARLWYTSGTSIERMDPFSNPVPGEGDRPTRLMSYALIQAIYVKLLFFPTFLCYDYSADAVPLVRSLWDARLLLVCAAYQALAILLAVSLRALRPGSWPSGMRGKTRENTRSAREGPIMGTAMLALSFLPMSNILFPVGTVIGERLLYIPSAGLLATLVCLSRMHRSWLSRGLLLVVGTFFVARCALRVPEWENAEAITVADGRRQERSTRVQFNLANERLAKKAYDEALFLYKRAISFDPEEHDSLPFYHAGQILIFKGQHAEAAQYLHKAVSGYYSPLTIQEEEIWHDYALSLWFTDKAAEAVLNFERALMFNQRFTKGWNNLACAAAIGAMTQRLGREHLQTAVHAIEQAVTNEPGNQLYWRNAVTILQWTGDMQTAERAWQQVQALSPGSPPSQDCSWEFYFR